MAIRTLLNSLERTEHLLTKEKDKLASIQTDAERLRSEHQVQVLSTKVSAINERIALEAEHKAKQREQRCRDKAERDRFVTMQREQRKIEKLKWKIERDTAKVKLRGELALERNALRRDKGVRKA